MSKTLTSQPAEIRLPSGQVVLAATPTKLRSGEWGAKIVGYVEKGEELTCQVSTRAGKTWVGEYKVIWTNGEIGLMAQIKTRNNSRSRSSYSELDGYGRCCPYDGSTCLTCGGSRG